MIVLANHFRRDDRSRHSAWLRQQKWFIKARQDRERREDFAEGREETTIGLASEAVIATQTQIRAFEAKLDIYDTATVEALELNSQNLDGVRKELADVALHIQQLLDGAYVMEDGRRVFLTEDRSKAFDEFGTEVSPDDLDFDLVPENAPTWESFSDALSKQDDLKQEFDQLEQERSDLIEFQGKLDDARDRTSSGEISEEELDKLDAELAEAMPSSVKALMLGLDTAANTTNQNSEIDLPTGSSIVDKHSDVRTVRPAPEPGPSG